MVSPACLRRSRTRLPTEGCSTCAAPGSCEAALPGRYRIILASVAVPTRKPDGTDWDVGGGAPDLYVVIKVDGATVLAMSAVADDTFSASFTGTFGDANLVTGSEILFEVGTSTSQHLTVLSS